MDSRIGFARPILSRQACFVSIAIMLPASDLSPLCTVHHKRFYPTNSVLEAQVHWPARRYELNVTKCVSCYSQLLLHLLNFNQIFCINYILYFGHTESLFAHLIITKIFCIEA